MTTTRRRFIALALAVPAAAALAGCTPLYRNHGYVPPDDELAQVAVGTTTQGELEALIGRPSSQGLLTGAAWYYVGSRWRTYGAFEPQEIDRQVVAVSFDANGVVANIERFGLERGRVVTLSRRVTDSGVTGVSLAGQLLGNLGNFNPAGIIGDDG
ncbi:outer membrane protein assembly factor BamE [Paracoccus aeridis]|uniref:outer membrane protein assembly factor BamE n=1 Tax=Paracoccus aeridis TaxID=1966466 RepID=UPI0010A9EC4E|nr:outer membrane protein assembly factor BamE [Paracoccus aeridis]